MSKIPDDYKEMLIDMSKDLDGTLSFHDCYDLSLIHI